MAETLREIGELGLIGRIAESAFTSPKVALGFQDDAALWQQGDAWVIATADALMEDVDFRLRTFSWEDIGWKALAANLSDIAAMGGVPRAAIVTLCLPEGCEAASVPALYDGMSLLAEEAQCPIVGGDLSASAQVMINITVLGAVESEERVLRRASARAGDLIAVTGVLGSAAAGLALLERGADVKGEYVRRFITAQRRPVPRLAEGRALVQAGVQCGMDLSDGLTVDLEKLCKASGVSAEVSLSRIPTDPELPLALGETHRMQAIAGGEDFELLFTAPPDTMRRARDYLATEGLVQSTIIGKIQPGNSGEVIVRGSGGAAVPLSRKGFDHFGGGEALIPGH